MIIACIVGLIILLSVIVVYSALLASRKADDDYEYISTKEVEELGELHEK